MATTTNYGWTTPDDTALVKDGAAAIRTLGSSIDSTLKTQIDAQIPDSLLTTKGDLIAATGASTPARLGVGTNGQALVADSTTATGLKWALPASGGMTLLSTTTLSGATVTISGIDQGYNRLVAYVFGVTNASGGGDFRIAPNGSTSISTAVMAQNLSYVGAFQDNYWLLASSPTLTRTNAENAWTFVIDNYSSTTARKSAEHYGGYISASYGSSAGAAVGFINTTTAITSLVFSNTGGNLSTGTVLLYGVK
jgi:hypothetical protein